MDSEGFTHLILVVGLVLELAGAGALAIDILPEYRVHRSRGRMSLAADQIAKWVKVGLDKDLGEPTPAGYQFDLQNMGQERLAHLLSLAEVPVGERRRLAGLLGRAQRGVGIDIRADDTDFTSLAIGFHSRAYTQDVYEGPLLQYRHRLPLQWAAGLLVLGIAVQAGAEVLALIARFFLT